MAEDLEPFRDLILMNGGRIRIHCSDEGYDDAWEEMCDVFAIQGLWHVGSFKDRKGSKLEATFNGEVMETIDMAKVMGCQ